MPTMSPKAKKSIKPLDLAMVSTVLFQYLTKQKDVEIFTISMQNLKYQLNKAEKFITDPATKVPECYPNFLDIFSKKKPQIKFFYTQNMTTRLSC